MSYYSVPQKTQEAWIQAQALSAAMGSWPRLAPEGLTRTAPLFDRWEDKDWILSEIMRANHWQALERWKKYLRKFSPQDEAHEALVFDWISKFEARFAEWSAADWMTQRGRTKTPILVSEHTDSYWFAQKPMRNGDWQLGVRCAHTSPSTGILRVADKNGVLQKNIQMAHGSSYHTLRGGQVFDRVTLRCTHRDYRTAGEVISGNVESCDNHMTILLLPEDIRCLRQWAKQANTDMDVWRYRSA